MLLPFLLLPLVQADERDHAPVHPDARLAPGVREGMRALDPVVGGWAGEALVEETHAALKDVEAALVGGRFEDLPQLQGAVRAGLEWAEPEGQGVLQVQPLTITDAEDLASALATWREGFEIQSAYLKAIGVEGRTLRLKIELSGDAQQVRGVALLTVAEDSPTWLGFEVLKAEWSRATKRPLFTDITSTALAGDAFERQLRPSLEHWRQRLDTRHGVGLLGHHGLALGDVNGDGFEDVYLCQPGGLPNRLYLRTPEGGTVEAAATAGVDLLDPTTSALILDVNGDGANDLVLAVADELAIFAGDGRGRFQGVWKDAAEGATSLAAADVNGDGKLDLFACGYLSPYDGTGTPEPYHDANNGQVNRLWLGQGGFQFTESAEERGLGGTRFSFAAAFEDMDADGDPDLYVANDFGRNRLYLNDGEGHFVDAAAAWGVEDLAAGMGVSFADVDGDGRFDLSVANMDSSAGKRVAYQGRFHPGAEAKSDYQRHAQGNSLFLNRGDRFEDVSVSAGVTGGRWAWGALFLDFENDGRPDLYVPNGFVTGERSDDL